VAFSENGEWRPAGEKQEACGETFFENSPFFTCEKKLGFPFSENGPSAIQGEGATSSFSDLREWEERGVTTPNGRLFPSILLHFVQ
jgi:hypothetical protein